MSSWFNTTTSLQHVTQLPDGIPAAKVVDLLQAHEFYMKCNPHMTKYELVDPPKEKPTIPEARNMTATSEPECYRVTDKVHTLPAGLWDSDVVSTYEFLNVEKGVFVRIRSPMSVVMETLWSARESSDGKVELVEEVSIFCSRILAGTIKSMCDSSWEGIHGTMVKKLQDDAAK